MRLRGAVVQAATASGTVADGAAAARPAYREAP